MPTEEQHRQLLRKLINEELETRGLPDTQENRRQILREALSIPQRMSDIREVMLTAGEAGYVGPVSVLYVKDVRQT